MTKPRWIETREQAAKAMKVISMLEHKVKKGIATPEERARYAAGTKDLLIWDWGTDAYQNHVPHLFDREKPVPAEKQKVLAPAPTPAKRVALPPLTKRKVV